MKVEEYGSVITWFAYCGTLVCTVNEMDAHDEWSSIFQSNGVIIRHTATALLLWSQGTLRLDGPRI